MKGLPGLSGLDPGLNSLTGLGLRTEGGGGRLGLVLTGSGAERVSRSSTSMSFSVVGVVAVASVVVEGAGVEEARGRTVGGRLFT